MVEEIKPVGGILSMLGIEIYELTEQLGAVELTLQHCLEESNTLNVATMHHLQSIDLISQTLAALSNFTLSLATLVPSNVEVDISKAVNQITLSDLAARLKGDVKFFRETQMHFFDI